MVAITMEMMIAVSVVMIIAMTAEQLLEVQLEFQEGLTNGSCSGTPQPHSGVRVEGEQVSLQRDATSKAASREISLSSSPTRENSPVVFQNLLCLPDFGQGL